MNKEHPYTRRTGSSSSAPLRGIVIRQLVPADLPLVRTIAELAT